MCAVQRIPIFEVEKIIWLCYTETVRGDQVRIRKIAQLLFLLLLLITLTACGSSGRGNTGFVDGRNFGGVIATAPTDEKETRSTAVFSGACYGVIIDINTSDNTITILDLVTEMEAEYGYSGGTYMMDKYGKDIAVNQLSLGDIIEGGYDAGTRMLKELKKSPQIWENQRVTNFSINRLANTILIGQSLYEYMDNLVIVSDGRLLDSVSEISNQDELIVRGNENTVYSIEIIKGHGYVTLSNAEYFENGVVMIGSRIARKVVEDMILEVPEGEYILEITKDGVGGSKNISVEKNEETRVDVGSLKGEAREKGSIRFMIEPSDAVLYIDGEQTDYKDLVKLNYGAYKLKVKAENYVTYSGDLLVSENYQKREIQLGLKEGALPEQESSSEESSQETSEAMSETYTEQENTSETSTAETTTPPKVTTPTVTAPTVTAPTVTAPTVTAPTVTAPPVPIPEVERTEGMGSEIQGMVIENAKIHVEAPVGAAVYFDGEYVGVAPVSFQKVSGEHTIIFRQNGYETKSYTVTISASKTDSHYSYPALEPN